MSENNVPKKLVSGIVVLIILSICLCITTAALVFSMITVDNNIFKTGSVKINLNDGKPVIEQHEYQFEPGMTVEKDFFIENISTGSVYYRIYFANVEGGLADVLQITVSDGNNVLYQGTASELTRENVPSAPDPLAKDETRWLTISFFFPSGTGNSAQDLMLKFDLCADAVQFENNDPNSPFD